MIKSIFVQEYMTFRPMIKKVNESFTILSIEKKQSNRTTSYVAVLSCSRD